MTTTQSHPMLRRPPGVARFARLPWAPSLVTVFVGEDALARLKAELTRQTRLAARYRDVWSPTLALPPGIDPVDFQWPVRDRHMAIIGDTRLPVLLRLAQALLRDGAGIVAGLHEGELFLAKDQEVRHAA